MAKGTIGTLVYTEQNEQNENTPEWLVFPDKKMVQLAKKSCWVYYGTLYRLTSYSVYTDYITFTEGLTILILNCQCLKKHSANIQDSSFQKSKLLFLSETWLSNEENVQQPNFNCIVKFKQDNVTANIARTTTLNIELTI